MIIFLCFAAALPPKKSPDGPTTLRSNVSSGGGGSSSSSQDKSLSKSTKKPVASPRRRPQQPPPGQDPATCDIAPGADTTIEITKDKDEDGKPMGLGLSIVGGSDTLLGAIFIHEVLMGDLHG